jgi:hypothetical protein
MEDEQDNNQDDEEDNVEERDQHVEVIAKRFADMGYTITDVITMLINRPSRINVERGTNEFIEKMEGDFDKLVDDADREFQEAALFEEEDSRSATHVEKAALGLLFLSQYTDAI